MGGYIASLYTINNPQKVASLKLLSPAKIGDNNKYTSPIGNFVIVYK